MVNQDLGKVAVVARGAYDSKVEYERLDAVTYNGSSYLVRQRCRGVTPAEGTYYMLMAQAGDSTAANTAAEAALRAAEAANAATTAANTAAASAQEVVDTVMPDVTQLYQRPSCFTTPSALPSTSFIRQVESKYRNGFNINIYPGINEFNYCSLVIVVFCNREHRNDELSVIPNIYQLVNKLNCCISNGFHRDYSP